MIPALIALIRIAPSGDIALAAVPVPPLKIDLPRGFLLFRTARLEALLQGLCVEVLEHSPRRAKKPRAGHVAD